MIANQSYVIPLPKAFGKGKNEQDDKETATITDGFIVTVEALIEFIKENGMDKKIVERLSEINHGDTKSMRLAGLQIRSIIRNANFPKPVNIAIVDAYQTLSKANDEMAAEVSVRSDIAHEKPAMVHFAGDHQAFWNVQGTVDLINAIRNCCAPIFTEQAILHRENFKTERFIEGVVIKVKIMS